MSESVIASLRAKRKSSFLKRAPIQSTAARTSGTRMRPSPSVSSSFSVAGSKRRPSVDAASTVHSFWSSSFSAARSSPFSSLTCTQRADLKNFHLYIVCSSSWAFLCGEMTPLFYHSTPSETSLITAETTLNANGRACRGRTVMERGFKAQSASRKSLTTRSTQASHLWRCPVPHVAEGLFLIVRNP